LRKVEDFRLSVPYNSPDVSVKWVFQDLRLSLFGVKIS